jgi:hypothetical protein
MLAFLCLIISMTANAEPAELPFTRFVQIIKNQQGTERPPALHVHSNKILKIVKDKYSSKDLDYISKVLRPAVEIKVHSNGLVQASDRPINSKNDPTHYDAIWVRDTLWAFLGLQAQNKNDQAKKVLLKMLDYFSSSDQLKRFSNVIEHPEAMTEVNGAMDVVHIRFDGESKNFQDVQIKGQPQKWNHKQNDALGLFYDLILKELQNKTIASGELSQEQYQVLAFFPAYFSRIKFYEMEDAGSWEEIEKVATSSVGLVTSSLERLSKILKDEDQRVPIKIKEAALKLKLDNFLTNDAIDVLVTQGYDRIVKQLKAGGESPLYKTDDPRHRLADVALLNLIYPAELSQLTPIQKIQILNLVSPLVGEVGIKRYLGDSYQSGNFWLQPSANTDDNSSAKNFTDRTKRFIPRSEAQWFFDSWFSKCAGLLFDQTQDTTLRNLEITHFNRALAQITGGSTAKKYLTADDTPVTPFALPESYNTVVLGKNSYFAPSPITPLNWAKASLSIALDEMKRH